MVENPNQSRNPKCKKKSPAQDRLWIGDCIRISSFGFRISRFGFLSISLERHRFAVDLGQGVHGGLLLGFLLVAAPGRGERLPADEGGDLEALAVVGAFF